MKNTPIPTCSIIRPAFRLLLVMALAWLAGSLRAATYLDNETIYSNQDPNTETRRSDHYRMCFGHYDRDGGMSEAMALGNLQMFEAQWQRNIVELGLNDLGQSAILEKRDGNSYKVNFHFLMTWNDGGGGGAYMSMDGNGYSFCMGNPTYCRWDPPSGATPHEMGHVWEGQARGFNGSDSSGAWWECTANWYMCQLLNAYPNPGGLLWNSMYYPAHGRDYYDSWAIYEAARENPLYGAAYVNNVWTNCTPDQQAHEYIVDRMVRVDSSGSADKAGANRDLWGEMARKCVTWDYERQRWFASANSAEDGSDWYWYQRCRTPLVKLPGAAGWYRPARAHLPMEYGFNIIPLTATPGTTVTCTFQPQCDPVRQSDWRACLVAVSSNNDARYSKFWNVGANSMSLSADETRLFLVVIATPKPMKIGEWNSYLLDSGMQFPYAVSFANATPRNVRFPYTGTYTTHPNGGGKIGSGAVVAATAYVSPNAMVLDSAHVNGYARIEDYAVVRNNAVVEDNAVVSGHAMVQDSAHVYGNAKVRDWARVFGNAQIYENAKVIEHANVGDNNNIVFGSAVIKGTTYMYSPSTFSGSFIMDGDSANGGAADRGVHFGWQWGQNASIFTGLTDNGYLYARHSFEQTNALAVFAKDELGINHGFLMNGCRTVIEPTRGGRVLALNGVNQYVELHNSVNDFRETGISLWVNWTGSTAGQRIWSFGDGTNKVMYLTPQDATTGLLRLVVTNGATTQYLDGPSALPANTWTHVAVTFGSPVFNTTTRTWSGTGILYVNGSVVAALPGMILPDSLSAPLMENANFLGRGNSGNYFQGYVDDFRVYSKTLAPEEVTAIYSEPAPDVVTDTPDSNAPTPNAPTWLVSPQAISDSAIVMSATPGADESGWVEYYFACTGGGGHDSGWVSFNRYTDCNLNPGTAYTYTIQMRDRFGNITSVSAPAAATTQTSSIGVASFAYGPVGITNGQITMTAAKLTNASGKVEYKFDRSGGSGGWQASPTWTETGLGTGSSYTYTVTVRDGRGNTSPTSAGVAAIARDDAAPRLPIVVAHWTTMPYATIDNKVSMTAMDATDPSGVQYYFQCTSGGAPDSGWQDSPTYTTPALADGTYAFRYKLRDKSARFNESGWSSTLLGPDYKAVITPKTGYHAYSLSQVPALADDTMVSFSGTVIGVNNDNYIVRDTPSGVSIPVKPSTYGQVTYMTNAFKNVVVKGHLYTIGGVKQVTYANITVTGAVPYAISGSVTNLRGAPVNGATVYFSTTPNASTNPAAITYTDATGKYNMPIADGTWYVQAVISNLIYSTERTVVMSSANVTNVNFLLPEVINQPATAVSASGAMLSAMINPGALATTVKLYWGTNDGGTVRANWGHELNLGTQPFGRVIQGLNALSSNTKYYYTFYLTNSQGGVFASPSLQFTTLERFLPEWPYSMSVSIPGYDRSEALQNFPLLLKFNTSISNFNYSTFLPGAADLRFTDGTGSLLDYEIESWDPAGDSFVWVKVPQLTPSTSVIAYWGNAAATAPTSSTNVWSDGFLAVWHMNNGTVLDSSPNANNETYRNRPDLIQDVTGMIGPAKHFDGSGANYIATGNTDMEDMTVSVWATLDDVNGWHTFLCGANDRYQLESPFGSFWFEIARGNGGWAGTPQTKVPGTGQWFLMTGTRSGNRISMYINGALVGYTDDTNGITHAFGSTYLGTRNPGERFHAGNLDEARVENVARGTNWIWACYQNQSSPDTFTFRSTVDIAAPPGVLFVTYPPSAISSTAATVSAGVTSGTSVTAAGTTYGTSPNPVTNPVDLTGPFTAPPTRNFTNTLSSLTPGTHYYSRAWASQDGGVTRLYSSQVEFFTEPNPASSLVFSGVNNTGMTLSWTPPSGAYTGAIIIMSAGSPVTAVPADGVSYAVGASLGNGQTVAYTGSASTVTLSGLAFGTQYYFALYPYAGTGSLANYRQSSPLIGNRSTTGDLASALRHRYGFNEPAGSLVAVDSVGGANATLVGSGAALTGTGLTLNGNASYAQLPNNLFTNWNSITVETWVQNNGSGGWARVWDFGNAAGVNMLLTWPSGANNLRIVYNKGNGEQQVNASLPSNGAIHHIVFTQDGATQVADLYVDGVKTAETTGFTLTPAAIGTMNQIYFGKSQYNDPYFNGVYDELRIWNIALSQATVQANYAAGPNAAIGPVPDPVAGIALSGQNVQVTFNTLGGLYYRVVYAPSLTTPIGSWTPVSPGYQSATGSSMTVTDYGALSSGNVRFYRVEYTQSLP